MSLVIEAEDEDGYIAARDRLMDRFEKWLATIGPLDESMKVMLSAVGGALDWKWGYADGDLARWTLPDVREFLLEWCPRKLSIVPAHVPEALAGFGAFATFLESEGLLAPGSASSETIQKLIIAVGNDFMEAMSDPSRFGPAKALVLAASAEGVDLTDAEEMQQWVDDFNARSMEERRGVFDGIAPEPSLPPVPPPDGDEVRASQAEAPILAMFARFAEFVGDGRKLTQTGRLTLADARQLVDDLGTGDRMDPVYGDRTFKTVSSEELPHLRQVFAWARKAGVVRVAHGRVIATKLGLKLAEDPVAGFDRAVDALFDLGPVTSGRVRSRWSGSEGIFEFVDSLAVEVLSGPYITRSVMPLEALAARTLEIVHEAFEFRYNEYWTEEYVERLITGAVTEMVDGFALAGLVRRVGAIEPEAGPWRRQGGDVELTPAGAAAARRLRLDAGYPVPPEARFTGASAAELIEGVFEVDDGAVVFGEVAAWRERRSPAEAAAGLADAVRELDDPGLRNAALALLEETGLDVAEPEVRRLATEPYSRGFALCWLVDHALEEPAVLYDADDEDVFVDVLFKRSVEGGPDVLVETLALAGDSAAQVALLRRLWRSPSPVIEDVLEAIGHVHPVRAVAKEARKSAFRRRSGGKSRPHR